MRGPLTIAHGSSVFSSSYHETWENGTAGRATAVG